MLGVFWVLGVFDCIGTEVVVFFGIDVVLVVIGGNSSSWSTSKSKFDEIGACILRMKRESNNFTNKRTLVSLFFFFFQVNVSSFKLVQI